MDFKFKGKSWASNIYRQFESICQNVDDFMNQDTQEFVESQVQSVKELYSDVVPDTLPLSGDTVTSEAQSVDCEQDGVQNNETSTTGIAMEPTHVKKLSINQGSVDTMRNSFASLPTEHDHASGSAFHEANDHLHLSEENDGIILNNSDSSFQVNNNKDTMVVIARSSSRNDIYCEMSGDNHMNSLQTVDPLLAPSACKTGPSDEDHRNSTPNMDSSPSGSNHQAGNLAIKEETIIHYSYFEDTEQMPAVSTSDGAFKNKLPMGDNPNSDVQKGLSVPFVTSPDEDHKVHECVTPDSLPLSSSDAADRTLSNSDENRSISAPSITPSNQVRELECVTMHSLCPSISDVAAAAVGTNEALCETFSSKDDVPRSHQSSEICTVADVLPAHPIPKTKGSSVITCTWEDRVAFWINASDSEVRSSENRQEQLSEIGESKYSISSFDIGNSYEYDDGAHDPNMETIDLSSGVKHEESDVWGSTFIHSASHGRRNLRYYKNLIQGAFTSRKRLSKEYEHLAILYGDIDKEARHHFQPSSDPSSPKKFVHDMLLHSAQEMCDAEWELL